LASALLLLATPFFVFARRRELSHPSPFARLKTAYWRIVRLLVADLFHIVRRSNPLAQRSCYLKAAAYFFSSRKRYRVGSRKGVPLDSLACFLIFHDRKPGVHAIWPRKT
jgi:hypothetical protein